MRNLTKMVVVVFLMGQSLLSCSKNDTVAEDQLYDIQATEGDNQSDDHKPPK